ncbi:MAG: adenylate/guanylate cyclase domain-containing protein [Pseudomonadota bacterium]
MEHGVTIEHVEDWLIGEALGDPDILLLFENLCRRLNAAGIPLDRASVTWPTLHPLFRAEQILWRKEGGCELFQYALEEGLAEAWLKSPFHYALVNHLDMMRRRLIGPEMLVDFEVLEEFRDDGYTDYLLTSTDFQIANVNSFARGDTGIIASWATQREDGFAESDMQALTRIQRIFAVACRASIQQRIMNNIAQAYLGRIGAERVLSGNIRLGDGERIRAIVWFSDLRGSSWLSFRMAPDAYLAMLRKYYACTAQSVIDEGGEVLDFIGDGVLGIFPVKGDFGLPDAVNAATRAMETALRRGDALAAERQAAEPEISFSVVMAAGEVMFGNVGVDARLVFTAIGETVNIVTRIDDLTKTLGRSVLVTEEIAQVDPDHWLSVGQQAIPGMNTSRALYARACEVDRFDNDALVERMRAALEAS